MSGALAIVTAPLIGLALLLFAAAAIPTGYVRWPRAAMALQAHRSDLVTFGFGAFGVAFIVVFCLLFLGP